MLDVAKPYPVEIVTLIQTVRQLATLLMRNKLTNVPPLVTIMFTAVA